MYFRDKFVIHTQELFVNIDILIAEKEGSPWPNDIYGHALVPITKDGKIIGAYSIGKDGVDAGWESESDMDPIWLYDHIEAK